MAGFAVPATAGAAAYALGALTGVLFALLPIAGAGEGALLALGQSYLLRREIPG